MRARAPVHEPFNLDYRWHIASWSGYERKLIGLPCHWDRVGPPVAVSALSGAASA